jgi:hypothetical protein
MSSSPDNSPIAHLIDECERALAVIPFVSPSGGQSLQTVIDQLWAAWQSHLSDVAAPSRPSVSTKAEALAAVEGLRQRLRGLWLEELETTILRYSAGPFRGQGTILQPKREVEISPARLNKLKEEEYGRGGCLDGRVGPGETIPAVIQLMTDAAVFSDPGSLGGGNPAELEEGGHPKLAETLVAAITRLWRAIPNGRLLLRLWGNAIANLRDCREFEWQGRYWPSACHFTQHLAESELAEAWGVVDQVCPPLRPPIAETDCAFEEGCPMPRFHVDRWYSALPALRRHFANRGDVWGLAVQRSKVFAALEQEASRLIARRQEKEQQDDPTDPFRDFIHHQRTLLLTLWRKGKVPIKTVLKKLYGTDSNDNVEALLGVIKRTKRKLCALDTEPRYDISRKGENLELHQL